MFKRRGHIFGIRMTQERKTEMKAEAVRRGMSVADLFEEMWTLYRSTQKEAADGVEQ